MTYIATFFTHFAAISFSRALKGSNMHPQLMPVPRKLSSSCGTCVRFVYDGEIVDYAKQMDQEDLDSIYRVEGEEYLSVYTASSDN